MLLIQSGSLNEHLAALPVSSTMPEIERRSCGGIKCFEEI
jgi:hypothetical protein